jgi:hypothetical protein
MPPTPPPSPPPSPPPAPPPSPPPSPPPAPPTCDLRSTLSLKGVKMSGISRPRSSKGRSSTWYSVLPHSLTSLPPAPCWQWWRRARGQRPFSTAGSGGRQEVSSIRPRPAAMAAGDQPAAAARRPAGGQRAHLDGACHACIHGQLLAGHLLLGVHRPAGRRALQQACMVRAPRLLLWAAAEPAAPDGCLSVRNRAWEDRQTSLGGTVTHLG